MSELSLADKLIEIWFANTSTTFNFSLNLGLQGINFRLFELFSALGRKRLPLFRGSRGTSSCRGCCNFNLLPDLLIWHLGLNPDFLERQWNLSDFVFGEALWYSHRIDCKRNDKVRDPILRYFTLQAVVYLYLDKVPASE
jgi:hypothetical protein